MAMYHPQRTKLWNYIINQGYKSVKDFWVKNNLSDKLSYNTLYGWCNDTSHNNNATRSGANNTQGFIALCEALKLDRHDVENLILSRGNDDYNKLKTIRVNLNLSQKEMAELIGCDPRIIGDIENGRRKIFSTTDELKNYLELTDLSFHEYQDIVNSIYVGKVENEKDLDHGGNQMNNDALPKENKMVDESEEVIIERPINEKPSYPSTPDDYILSDDDINLILDTVYGRINRRTYIRLENVLNRYMR